jgi:hypothetical protein
LGFSLLAFSYLSSTLLITHVYSNGTKSFSVQA